MAWKIDNTGFLYEDFEEEEMWKMVYEDLFGKKYTDQDLNNIDPSWLDCLEIHVSE